MDLADCANLSPVTRHCSSHSADPLAVFPDRLDGGQVAGIENIFGRARQVALFQVVPGVTGADGHELQHARVAIAINHATRTAIPDEFGIVPVPHLAHRLFPEMTPEQVQVPIQVEILVPAQAAEFFLFPAQMALHLRERFRGVHHRITAVVFHPLDLLEQFDELGRRIIHQAAVAEAQIAALQVRQRIAEGAAREPECFQEGRQLFVIINQAAGRDAGRGLNAGAVEKFVRFLNLLADIRQTAVFLVFRDVMRVNGHDDAAQTVTGQAAHVVVIPQPAVGADHRMNPAFRRVAGHGAQVPMHHRLAAHEEQVTNMILERDVNHALRLVQRHAAARLGIKLAAGEPAETAIRIANVRDGKLQVTRSAVVQDILDELELAGLGANHRLGKIRGRSGFGFGRLGAFAGHGAAHFKYSL